MEIELQKYQKCLFEIKKRTEVINDFLTRKKTIGYLISEVEFICLQFRKIIELIALSSLVANKEEYSKQHEKFETHWNARLIFQDLERINSKFYPEPSKQIEKLDNSGKRYFNFEPIKSGYLTKDKAIQIYEKCGGILHADNPFRGEKNIKDMYNLFPKWLSEIITLLNHHCIVLHGKNQMIVGLMQAKDDGNPKVFLFEEVDHKEAEELKKNFN